MWMLRTSELIWTSHHLWDLYLTALIPILMSHAMHILTCNCACTKITWWNYAVGVIPVLWWISFLYTPQHFLACLHFGFRKSLSCFGFLFSRMLLLHLRCLLPLPCLCPSCVSLNSYTYCAFTFCFANFLYQFPHVLHVSVDYFWMNETFNVPIHLSEAQ